jgi:hypothetical protein
MMRWNVRKVKRNIDWDRLNAKLHPRWFDLTTNNKLIDTERQPKPFPGRNPYRMYVWFASRTQVKMKYFGKPTVAHWAAFNKARVTRPGMLARGAGRIVLFDRGGVFAIYQYINNRSRWWQNDNCVLAYGTDWDNEDLGIHQRVLGGVEGLVFGVHKWEALALPLQNRLEFNNAQAAVDPMPRWTAMVADLGNAIRATIPPATPQAPPAVAPVQNQWRQNANGDWVIQRPPRLTRTRGR